MTRIGESWVVSALFPPRRYGVGVAATPPLTPFRPAYLPSQLGTFLAYFN